MSKIQKKKQSHKYLVCAIYDGRSSIGNITRIKHVAIVITSSPSNAVVTARRSHNPGEVIPRRYIASLILGDFKTNAFSDRTHTCEELLER